MSKNRIKTTLPTINSRDEAEALVGEIALATLSQIRMTAKMDAEIAVVRQRYEGNLSQIADDLKAKADTLRAWAEANPEQFPKDRKSIDFVQGKIGFRTGTPKLALLSRGWTWGKVLDAIRARAFQFIRSTEEVDKDAILTFARDARDAKDAIEVVEKVLKPIGVKVVQEESFFVEPNITDVEVRQVAEVA